MQARLRWPDGARRSCYSPSLVLAEHLEAGASYPVDDFLRRTRTALTEASERVRARYGFPCSRAAASLSELEREARRFEGMTDAHVVVESLDRL